MLISSRLGSRVSSSLSYRSFISARAFFPFFEFLRILYVYFYVIDELIYFVRFYFSDGIESPAGNRQKVQPITSVSRGTVDVGKEIRASTLPRRRGDGGHSSTTTPRNSPNRQNSPRASTPSLDSAVGSAEGLGVVSQPAQEEIRPRSDGSDSLATSSALTSPEPPTILGDHHQHHHHPDISRPESVQSKSNTAAESSSGEQLAQGSETSVEEANSARGKRNSTEQMARFFSLGEQLIFHRHAETWIEPHEVIITPPEEPRLSQASEGSEATSETPSPEALSPSGKIRRSRGDNSKRRKGVYITQWPEPSENDRNKLAAQSSEEREDPSITWSDLSDCEGHTPRRSVNNNLRYYY